MKDIIYLGFVALLVGLGLSLLFALPVMWLWNTLMPDLFGLQQIGFWQAFGLPLLARFIFGTGSSSSSKS